MGMAVVDSRMNTYPDSIIFLDHLNGKSFRSEV
ncbi:hypothetical protein SAMN05444955_11516 [Lihuaxuella thermophila]|uniref:Uncharacterized protein n=1 Tax=Lihuaxuella thermophila TaxID=1173111 RepID=A0A1H8HS44_9BACL|nr:hypothetical protein SAMN05444955_11516 [Lihuaxuella thermophila]